MQPRNVGLNSEAGTQHMSLHLPAGTVTFLLTDIEGSTALWEAEPTEMASSVARHYALIDDAVSAAGGVRPVEQGEGDSAVAAFRRPSDAVSAAVALQQAMSVEKWATSRPLKVRMAIHTGEARFRDAGNYMGEAIIRTARLRSVAHGGQIVVSAPAYAVAVDHLGDQIEFRDLGVHRLKDLARPEQVFQLCASGLQEDFPALRSLDLHSHNLPVQLSPFIGRLGEITTVAALVSSHRLVTLCGSGGVGKTRLAQQVAAEVIEWFPDGVWWVELAAVTEPDEVSSALAAVLGLVDRAGLDVSEALARLIGTRRMLVVMDNCEHVIDAVAVVVDRLLRACAGLSMIATSRASLEVPGELAWRVPPLRLPDDHQSVALDVLAQSDSVQLFADRAGRARPNFRLGEENGPIIAAICRRLDGVALAIELAAARVRSFTPAQILAGLDDALRTLTGGSRSVLPRQQTLEASVRWSHTLLADSERILLRRLAVFRGGFSLDAAEGVTADELLPVGEILDRLDHLVDQSLVMADDNNPGRYRLLETVRQFAARQLEDTGEAEALRDSHAAFYADLTRRLGAIVLSNRMIEAVDELAVDLDNLRVALGWLADRSHTDRLCSMVADAGLFWGAAGLLRDGENWLTQCIDCEGYADDTRARLLLSRAHVRLCAGLMRESLDDSPRARELADSIGDHRTAALALMVEARCMWWIQPLVSQPLMEQATQRAARSNDEMLQLWTTICQAFLFILTNRVEAALSIVDSIRTRTEEIGSPLHLGDLLVTDSFASLHLSDYDRTITSARQLGRLSALGIHGGFVRYLEELALSEMGAHDSIDELPTEIDELERAGYLTPTRGMRYILAVHHLAVGDIETAEHDLRDLLAETSAAGISLPLSWYLAALAATAHSREQYDEAARLIAQGRQVHEQIGNLHSGARIEQRAASLARCRGEVNEAEQTIHRAIDMQHPNHYRAEVVVSLEILVGILTTTRRMTDAARLAGAAQAERDRLGFRMRIPPELEIYPADLATIEQALGAEGFAQAVAEGAAMSLDEAVAYAQRSRGRRGRPAFGWDSLTPTEQDVVALITEGRTNVEIAQRLLVSRETVKTHLSHIYTKLHVRTRAQLAALAATRAAHQS